MQPGVPLDWRLVGEGQAPHLELSVGKLPAGLRLENGSIRGKAQNAGEHQRFVVNAYSDFGDYLGSQTYLLAVGVSSQNLSETPKATRSGDTLSFSQDWGSPLQFAYAWDANLQLLWPMKVDASVSGKVLAPGSGALTVVAAGPNVRGVFQMPTPALDEQVGVVTQLTWAEDADLELAVVPQSDRGVTVTGSTTTWPAQGDWMVRHEIADASGVDVQLFAKGTRAGRYALVATKIGGTAAELNLWLSIRKRDGSIIADTHTPAFISDLAAGALSDEVATGRQSYRTLGCLDITADGQLTFIPATTNGVLFDVEGGVSLQ